MEILLLVVTTLATIVIAYYAYRNHQLTEEIKRVSSEQQENMNKFIMALIASSLFIAQYSHTSKKDVKIKEFDCKLKEVENYFSGGGQA